MIVRHLIDTGPIVAYLDPRDVHHAWAVEVIGELRPPLLTCEPVLAEACYLLRRLHTGPQRVLSLVERGLISPDFRLVDEAQSVASLMRRYRDVPMDLADACLVRMAEVHERATVLTIDSDFTIYRKHGRRVIPARRPA